MTKRKPPRRRTAKQRVLAKYQEARCVRAGDGWWILTLEPWEFVEALSARAAWADAAKRLRGRP